MRPIDERDIRASFINASVAEVDGVLPPLAYEGFDREAARDARIVRLGKHVRAFLREVAG